MALLSVAAFKVHFTSLSRYWSPCTVSRSSPLHRPFKCCSLYCVAGGLLLCVCFPASLIECVLCLTVCLRGCRKSMCCRGDRCTYHLKHAEHGVCTRVYTVYILVFVYHACALLLRPACLHSQSGLCLFVSTYISANSEHSRGESEAERTHFQPTVISRCLSAEQ